MAPVVVLSLGLMIVAAAVAALAGLRLWRVASAFTTDAKATLDRVAPLTEELREGVAVTTTEVEALRQSVQRLQTARDNRKRRQR